MKLSDFSAAFETSAEKMNEGIKETRNTLITYIKWLQDTLNMDCIMFDAGAYFPNAANFINYYVEEISGVKVSKTGDLMFKRFVSEEKEDDWVIADNFYDYNVEDIYCAVQEWVNPRTDYINTKAESKSNSESQTALTDLDMEKLRAILNTHYALHETEKLMEYIFDDERNEGDIKILLKRFADLAATDNGELPVAGHFCPKCGAPLYPETDLDIDYRFVCHRCDENFYEFESWKTNAPVEEDEPEKPKQKYRIRYAMEMFVDADSPEDAEQIFEDADIKEGDFVEVEDIS